MVLGYLLLRIGELYERVTGPQRLLKTSQEIGDIIIIFGTLSTGNTKKLWAKTRAKSLTAKLDRNNDYDFSDQL